MIFQRGLKINPSKITVIQNLKSPKNIKEVQCLSERITVTNRFLSKSGEKSLPSFELLRNPKIFFWTFKCETTFQNIKQYSLLHRYQFLLCRVRSSIYTSPSLPLFSVQHYVPIIIQFSTLCIMSTMCYRSPKPDIFRQKNISFLSSQLVETYDIIFKLTLF